MLRHISLAAAFMIAATGLTLAACPPAVVGSTPEAIRANGERLICLQNELAAATAQRKYEFDLKALENRLQDIELKQRLNALPPPYAPVPVFR